MRKSQIMASFFSIVAQESPRNDAIEKLFASPSPPFHNEKYLLLPNPNDENPPPFFSTKKALHLCLESPLTHYECSGMFLALERASGPSGSSKPGTLTRQSPVLGFPYSFIFRLSFLPRLYFSLIEPSLTFPITFSPNTIPPQRRPCRHQECYNRYRPGHL